MRFTIKTGLFFIVSMLWFGCEKIGMEPNPATNNLAIFDEYATLVKEKYAMLDYKNVDIDFLADSIRATITEDLSDTELFEKLSIITIRLRDGHSDLTADIGGEEPLFASYDFLAAFPPAIDIPTLANNYTGQNINQELKVLEGGEAGFRAIWGTLPQDRDIAYCWIPSWNVDISDEEIETIFEEIADKKGLIFDMRQNTGGDPALATKVASYFTDKPVYIGFERFKTGPAPNDFSDSPLDLQPASSDYKFLKPVAILTDRYVYSASTTFLYSVDPLENIVTIGQKSGGGSGSVADGYLANGWKWSLSVSEFIDADGRHLDDGVEADIPVIFDISSGKDELIERAILELN